MVLCVGFPQCFLAVKAAFLARFSPGILRAWVTITNRKNEAVHKIIILVRFFSLKAKKTSSGPIHSGERLCSCWVFFPSHKNTELLYSYIKEFDRTPKKFRIPLVLQELHLICHELMSSLIEREKERNDGNFVFEGPEQIWISSACQGPSAYGILLALEKLYCATAQEKRPEREGLQEPGEHWQGSHTPLPKRRKQGPGGNLRQQLIEAERS